MKKSKNTLIKYSKRQTKTKTKRINRRSNKRINRKSNKRINRRSNKRIKKRSNKSNNKSKRKKNSFKRNLIKKSKSKLIGGNQCGTIDGDGKVVRGKFPGCYLPNNSRLCKTKEGILCRDNYDVDDECVCTPISAKSKKIIATCKRKPSPKKNCVNNKNLAATYENGYNIEEQGEKKTVGGRLRYMSDKIQEYLKKEDQPDDHLGRNLVESFFQTFPDAPLEMVFSSVDGAGGPARPFDLQLAFKLAPKKPLLSETGEARAPLKGDLASWGQMIQVEEKGNFSVPPGITNTGKAIPAKILDSMNIIHSKDWTPQSINMGLFKLNKEIFDIYTKIFYEDVIEKLPEIDGVPKPDLVQFRKAAKATQGINADSQPYLNMYKEKSVAKQSGFTKDDTREWEHNANIRFIKDPKLKQKMEDDLFTSFMDKYAKKYDQKDYWISTAGIPEGMKTKLDHKGYPYLPPVVSEADSNIMEVQGSKNLDENEKEAIIQTAINDLVDKVMQKFPGMMEQPDEEDEDEGGCEVEAEQQAEQLAEQLAEVEAEQQAVPLAEPEAEQQAPGASGGAAEQQAVMPAVVISVGNARYLPNENFAFCWHEGYQDHNKHYFSPNKCTIYVDDYNPGSGESNSSGLLKVKWHFDEKDDVPKCHQFKTKDRQIRFKNGGFSNLALGI